MKNLFLVPLFFFLFLSIPVHAVSVSINPTWDTYTRNASAFNTTNYGTATSLIFSIQSNDIARVYFLFNTSEIPSNALITSAYLKIYDSVIGPFGTKYFLAYNTSLAWNETNITWSNQPAPGTLQSNISVVSGQPNQYHIWNVSDAVYSSLSSDLLPLVVKADIENPGPSWTFASSSREGVGVKPYLEVNFSVPDCNTTIIGTYCDPNEISLYGSTDKIITSPDYTCNNDMLYQCPSGSLCTQITPQVNITTPLIENFTDCSKCIYVYTNVFLVPVLLYNNCPNNPECRSAINNASGSWRSNCHVGGGIITCPSVFITAEDSVPASAEYYTAGCFDPSLGWVPIVINTTGDVISIVDLTHEVFGNDTNLTTPYLASCPNSTTSCYILNNSVCQPALCTPDQGVGYCDNAGGQTALLMGQLFGITNCGAAQNFLAIIFSIGIGLLVFYYVKLPTSFAIAMLGGLVAFTLIGWFPAWIMVILIVLAAFVVAKMLGVGV